MMAAVGSSINNAGVRAVMKGERRSFFVDVRRREPGPKGIASTFSEIVPRVDLTVMNWKSSDTL